MSKIKIYELAKELDKSSKDIISFLKDKGIEVNSHMNSIEDNVVHMVRNKYQAPAPAKASEPTKRVETTTTNALPSHNQRMNNNRPNNQRNYENTGSQGYYRTDNQNNTRNDNRNDNRNMNNNNNNNNNNTNNNNNRPNNRFNNANDNRANNTNRPNDNRVNNTNRPNDNRANNTNRPNDNRANNTNRPNDNRANNTNRPNDNRVNNTNRPNDNRNNTNRPNDNRNNNQNNTSNNNQNNNNRNNRFDNRNNNNRNNNNNNRNGYNNNRNNNSNNNSNKNNSNNGVPRKGQFIMPKPVPVQEVEDDGIKTIIIPEVLTIKELSDKLKMPASVLVKKLFLQGKVVTINQEITFEEAEEIALEFEIIAELEEKVNVIEELLKEDDEDEALLEKRPPVVCVMGHVDHGKTSLLDTIRKAHVTNNEAGGITQHIGAYVVNVNNERITFLDTPGHEAFTSMRMRGAQSTDIAILVVAADDGVMPQTVEAINHAKAAGIQIIVAINKVDKPSANIERVKQELTEHELIAEDWGGDTVFVPVSAHTGEGIDQLLEMILLTAEMCELKANPNRKGRGIVIEAELDKGRGPVATVLVQKGILRVGDSIAIGSAYGKVRAMIDDKGRRVKEAGPSTPVEILGLNEVPGAGDVFMAMDNDKEARSIAEAFIKQSREKLLEDTKSKLSLDGLFSQIQAGNIKELNIIVKADVQGSVEAVKQSLLKLSNEEVAIRIIHGGVGAVNESDVILASASNAIIIGFNVRPDNTAKVTADREKVDLRLYRVIYNAIEDIEAAMKGMLDPTFEEKVLGHVEVRQVFKASGLGTIAGSYVLDGKVVRGSQARIIRDGIVIFDGDLASLKRFKDDVKEVAAGYECGLVFEKFNDVKEMDQVEIYTMVEVPRK
ncbi:MAG: translation initiation factor IF-2 [Clostridiales bacterium]|nr:translation initiation factor IF-2 [Clostridiales bacterium]